MEEWIPTLVPIQLLHIVPAILSKCLTTSKKQSQGHDALAEMLLETRARQPSDLMRSHDLPQANGGLYATRRWAILW